MEAFRLDPKKRPRELMALIEHCDALLTAKGSKANRAKAFWAERELATHISSRLEAQPQKEVLATIRFSIAVKSPIAWATNDGIELETLLRIQKRLLERILGDKDPWGDFKSSRENSNRKPHSGRYTQQFTHSLACLVRQQTKKRTYSSFTDCWEKHKSKKGLGKKPPFPRWVDGTKMTGEEAARELCLLLVPEPFLPHLTPEGVAIAKRNAAFSMRTFDLTKDSLRSLMPIKESPLFLARIRGK